MSVPVPREVSYERLQQSLQLIEHHINRLEHSPHMTEDTVSSIRLVVDDMKTSLRASARDCITSTPYTRKTVYTFGSSSPFSVVRSVVADGASRPVRRQTKAAPHPKTPLRSSARDTPPTPCTRKTVYTFSSSSPLSVVRNVVRNEGVSRPVRRQPKLFNLCQLFDDQRSV